MKTPFFHPSGFPVCYSNRISSYFNYQVKKNIFSVFVFGLFVVGFVQGQSTTATFNYTGAVQTWTVPPCVTSIQVDVRGARGGGSAGGNGARVTATLTVTPGQVLQINVGGMGSSLGAGWNGGGPGAPGSVASFGGGGASDIRITPYALGNRIIVASGGGGTGGGNTFSYGGAGGCNTGSTGGTNFGVGANGGTQFSGGAAGGPWGGGAWGGPGTLGVGGYGVADPCYGLGPGAGGGGGYYGGGGGGSDCFASGSLGGGGGGGGSSLTPVGGSCTAGTNSTNGIVTITYGPSMPPFTVTNTGPYCEGQTIQLNASGTNPDYDWTGPGGYVQNNTQNPTIPGSSAGMSGVYTVTVTGGSGCSATGTTSVVVNSLPVPTASNTGPYCAGTTIELDAGGGTGYTWTGPAAFSSAMQAPSIPGSTTAHDGVYSVTVTSAAGCTATTTTTVTVHALPMATASNTGPYCEGETMDVSSSGGADYDWAGPYGFSLNNTQNTTIPGSVPVMSGNYTVTVTDTNGCVSTAVTNILVNPLPVPSASNTGPYCAGDAVILNASGGAGYNWSGPSAYTDNTQNPVINAASTAYAGTYTVVVSSPAGCTATATTTVDITEIPVPQASNSGPYCEGQTIELFVAGGSSFAWSGPAGFASNDQNPTITGITVSNTGTYSVTATDGVGCTGSTTTEVIVHPKPSAVPLFYPQNPTTLNSEVNFSDQSYPNIVTWQWNIDGNVFTDPEFVHDFTLPGDYPGTLMVTNEWGCTDSMEFLITVTMETAIFIPNTFTPDGDGLNDIFFVVGGEWDKMEMVIFDRWGREVFYTNDPSKGWNGTRDNAGGEILMQGSYAYRVTIKDSYGKDFVRMGHVNLIK